MTIEFSWHTFNPHDAGDQALRSFLQLDIQHYPEQIAELISAIEQIRQGQLDVWQGGGNAYFCDISAQGAQFEIAIDDIDDADIPLVSLDGCLTAAQAWLLHCQQLD